MRLRHIKGAEEEIAESPYVVQAFRPRFRPCYPPILVILNEVKNPMTI
ncbi:MAG: hypothetical protein IIX57_03295 [Lachnospiraceae bacterium]|nr:hypothetical protein [Lachnospiraceae bacterium]